jgi:hypothetical protein
MCGTGDELTGKKFKRLDKGHGRIESREAFITSEMGAIEMVNLIREINV